MHESTVSNLIREIYLKKHSPAALESFEKMSLRSELGFDSFDLAELCVRIEDIYLVDVFEINSNIDSCLEILDLLIKYAKK